MLLVHEGCRWQRGTRPAAAPDPVLAGAVEGVGSTEHAELSDLPTVVRLLCRTVGPRLEATVCAAAAFCCEPCQEDLVAFVSCLNVSGTTIGTKMCGTVDCSNAGGGTPECVSRVTLDELYQLRASHLWGIRQQHRSSV